MSTPAASDVQTAIDGAFGPEVDREVTPFSSGAVSIDPDGAASFPGHDTVTSTLTDALGIARSALRKA